MLFGQGRWNRQEIQHAWNGQKNACKIVVGNPEGEHTCVRKDENKENLK